MAGGWGRLKMLWCENSMKFQLQCPDNLTGPEACLSPGAIHSCPVLHKQTWAFAAAGRWTDRSSIFAFCVFLGMFANLWAKTTKLFQWALWRRGQETKGAEGTGGGAATFCVSHTRGTFVWEAKLVQDLHTRLKSVLSLWWFGNGGL